MLDAVGACLVEWVFGGYVFVYFFFGVVSHSACCYEVVDDGELSLLIEVWVPAFAGMTGLGWDDGYCCYYLVVSLFEGS